MSYALPQTPPPSRSIRRVIGAGLFLLGLSGPALKESLNFNDVSGDLNALWTLSSLVTAVLGAALMRSFPSRMAQEIPLSQQPGGKFLLCYVAMNFLVLRLLGSAYLALAYGIFDQSVPLSPFAEVININIAAYHHVIISALATVGLCLFLPQLTPGLLNRPETVAAGLAKAVVLGILCAPLYFAGETWLNSGALAHGNKIAEVLPNLFRAIGGIAIAGSILVSMATQLSMAERSGEASKGPALSPDKLKELRLARMKKT